MEAYSSFAEVLPVAVGGLAGHVFPAEDGRFVGGCLRFVRLDKSRRRYVGGCVGHVVAIERRRFVGGCVGHCEPHPYAAHLASGSHGRAVFEALRNRADARLAA
jgi:hypothetical protein